MSPVRTLALVLLAPALAAAQAISLSHSGYVLGPGDAPLAGNHTFSFALYPAAGGALWSSGDCVVAVNAGYYAVELGTGCGAGLTASALASAASLGVTVDTVTLTPRASLSLTPRAVRAGVAEALELATGAAEGRVLVSDAGGAAAWSPSLTVTADGMLGVGKAPAEAVDVLGKVKASDGLCIGSDCRTSWPAATQWSGSGDLGYTGGTVSIGASSSSSRLFVQQSGAGEQGLVVRAGVSAGAGSNIVRVEEIGGLHRFRIDQHYSMYLSDTNGQDLWGVKNTGFQYQYRLPAFYARGTPQANLGTGVTKLSYQLAATATDNRAFNHGGHFNDATDEFVAPVKGLYWFSASCRFDGFDVSYARIMIAVNGNYATSSVIDYTLPHVIMDFGERWDPRYATPEVSGLVKLNANDKVTVWVESNGDTSWNHQGEDHFSGYLVTALDALP